MTKVRLELKLTKATYNFLKDRREKNGETFSEIIEKIVLQNQMKSEEFMEQFSDMLFEKFKPML